MTASLPEATPEHLTAMLRRAGVLGRAEVIDVAVETSRDTPISRITRLRLIYDGGGDAGPSHVFCKSQREGGDPSWREFGRKEVGFYWPLPPSTDRWHAVVAAHARFHAAWWDHEQLGISVGAFGDDSGLFDRHIAAMPGELATFVDRLGEPALRRAPARVRTPHRRRAAAARPLSLPSKPDDRAR